MSGRTLDNVFWSLGFVCLMVGAVSLMPWLAAFGAGVIIGSKGRGLADD